VAKLKRTRWYATAQQGTLHFHNAKVLTEWMSKIPDGVELEIVIDEAGQDPTTAQWAYLYSCVYAVFADHFGWQVDEVDSWMKREFQKANLIHLPNGLELAKSSFDKEWLMKYIDFCIRLAAREGVSVQPPDPNWKLRKGERDV